MRKRVLLKCDENGEGYPISEIKLSDLLQASWLHFLEDMGPEVIDNPDYTPMQFIRFFRGILLTTSYYDLVIENDLGEEGMIYIKKPWED